MWWVLDQLNGGIMAVKTTPFTCWKLSGKDADAFVRQLDESQPNKRAQEALSRGRLLCEQMSKYGYSSVKPSKSNFLKTAFNRIKQIVIK